MVGRDLSICMKISSVFSSLGMTVRKKCSLILRMATLEN